MPKKRLPKKLFMAWNYDGDEPFLDHDEDAGLLAEPNSTREVGVYQLVKKVKLVNKTTIEGK